MKLDGHVQLNGKT